MTNTGATMASDDLKRIAQLPPLLPCHHASDLGYARSKHSPGPQWRRADGYSDVWQCRACGVVYPEHAPGCFVKALGDR